MSVKIRLARIGKKHVPFYRVVVVDSRKQRDSAFLENIGTYDALNSKIVKFHSELYDKWVSEGAQPSDSAKKIYKQHKKENAQSVQSAPVVKKAAPAKKTAPAEKPAPAAKKEAKAPAKEPKAEVKAQEVGVEKADKKEQK